MSKINIIKHKELYLKKSFRYNDDIILSRDTKFELESIDIEDETAIYILSNNNLKYLIDYLVKKEYDSKIVELEYIKNDCESIITEWIKNTESFVEFKRSYSYFRIYDLLEDNKLYTSSLNLKSYNCVCYKNLSLEDINVCYDLNYYQRMLLKCEEIINDLSKYENYDEDYYTSTFRYTEYEFAFSEIDDMFSIKSRKNKIKELFNEDI